jgi:tetratricopeptide (TPR) repeat protein
VRHALLRVAIECHHAEQVAVPLLDTILDDIDGAAFLAPSTLKTHIMDYAEGDSFWKLPRSADVRDALETMARNGPNERIYKQLAAALETASDDGEQLRSLDRLGLYVRTVDTPLPMKVSSGRQYAPALREYGPAATTLQMTTAHIQRPELLAPLMAVTANSNHPAVFERAVILASQCISGHAALSNTAHDLLNRKVFDRAILLADAAIRHRPKIANGYWWRGIARAGLSEKVEALRDLRRVRHLAPKFSEALRASASLYQELGKHEKCLEMSRRGLKQQPDDLELLRRSVVSLEALGRRDEAAKELSALLQLAPEPLEERRKIVFLLHDLGEYEQAIDYAQKLIVLTPNDWRPPHFLAASYCALERYELVLDAAIRTIGLEPTCAEAFYFRAYARQQLGQIQDAIADLVMASHLDPRDQRIKDLMQSLSYPHDQSNSE